MFTNLYIIDNEADLKVHCVYASTEKVSLGLHGFDPDNLVWWAFGWMKGFITVMKMHKSSQSVSPFIAAGSMIIVSSFWGEVVLNSLKESFSLFVLPL